MLDFKTSYDDFIKKVERLMCPICSDFMSDDGHDSNILFRDRDGFIYEYYAGALAYPHKTLWCRNQHGFKCEDYKLGKHLSAFDEELETE